jgi:MYXO-CTERM domain-containing protein
LGGRLSEGQSLAPRLSILNYEFALPVVEPVSVDEVVALQLVPVYMRTHEPEREWGTPTSVIAIALDRDGHRIVGAPIEWSVPSGYVYEDEDPFVNRIGDDVLLLADCGNPPTEPQWRSVRVQAKIAGQHAFVDLEWLALPSDPAFDSIEPSCHGELADDGPDSGCSCSTTGSSPGVAIAGMPLVALVAIRCRRRRRERYGGHTAEAAHG